MGTGKSRLAESVQGFIGSQYGTFMPFVPPEPTVPDAPILHPFARPGERIYFAALGSVTIRAVELAALGHERAATVREEHNKGRIPAWVRLAESLSTQAEILMHACDYLTDDEERPTFDAAPALYELGTRSELSAFVDTDATERLANAMYAAETLELMALDVYREMGKQCVQGAMFQHVATLAAVARCFMQLMDAGVRKAA